MKPNLSSENDFRALTYIRNQIVHFGHAPSVRELSAKLKYKSPRSAALIIERLIQNGYITRRPGGEIRILKIHSESSDHAHTVNVPLVGTAPCGAPLLAVENVEAMIPISTRLAHITSKYFLLRASGDSMNLAGIQNGDLVLVRQQPTAESGQNVVALIDDEATIKQFHRTGSTITLLPRSNNHKHKPIILTNDFTVQGVVVATIPDIIH